MLSHWREKKVVSSVPIARLTADRTRNFPLVLTCLFSRRPLPSLVGIPITTYGVPAPITAMVSALPLPLLVPPSRVLSPGSLVGTTPSQTNHRVLSAARLTRRYLHGF